MGMRTGEKGRSFEGIWGGRNYEALASAFGMGPRFYERALEGLVLAPGMKALDLGCGPGGLSFALGARSPVDTQIHGVDLSVDQLDLASRRAGRVSCSLRFHRCSMDELPFPDGEFDLVMTSMALHETPPEVRRRTVGEVARVLREGGGFSWWTGAAPTWDSGGPCGSPWSAGGNGTGTTGTTSTRSCADPGT